MSNRNILFKQNREHVNDIISILLVYRYLITIHLPDFFSAIQVTIQLTEYSVIQHIFTIWIPDLSGNRMPTIVQLTPLAVVDLWIVSYLSLVCIWISCRILSILFCLEFFPNQFGNWIWPWTCPDMYSPGRTLEYMAWTGNRLHEFWDLRNG